MLKSQEAETNAMISRPEGQDQNFCLKIILASRT